MSAKDEGPYSWTLARNACWSRSATYRTYKIIVLCPTGLRIKIDCAGEDQKQFTSLCVRVSILFMLTTLSVTLRDFPYWSECKQWDHDKWSFFMALAARSASDFSVGSTAGLTLLVWVQEVDTWRVKLLYDTNSDTDFCFNRKSYSTYKNARYTNYKDTLHFNPVKFCSLNSDFWDINPC
jgi:hypothetical protein